MNDTIKTYSFWTLSFHSLLLVGLVIALIQITAQDLVSKGIVTEEIQFVDLSLDQDDDFKPSIPHSLFHNPNYLIETCCFSSVNSQARQFVLPYSRAPPAILKSV